MVAPSSAVQYNVTLPPLHKGRYPGGGQQAIEDAGKRFEVIICGRQWGKTTYGVRKTIKSVLETGGLYWWIAPSYKVARPGWRMLKMLANQLRDGGIPIQIHESERYVSFPKGEVWIKSADDPDSLRGETLSGVVFDEPAQTREETWVEVIEPALTIKKGWATFIGTPKGRNWVYHLWMYAETDPEWGKWRRLTVDNPYQDPVEIQSKRLTMSDLQFRQEYEADFGASQYLVYPEFDSAVHEWKGPVPEFVSYHGGLDFGGNSIGSHKSAGAWAGRTKQDELIICETFEESGPNIEERQLNWMAEQTYEVKRFQRIARMPEADILWMADKSQMWGIGIVRAAGYRIMQTKGGKDSVEEGIELVHRRLQERVGDVRVAKNKILLPGIPKARLYYLPHCRLVPAHFETYRYEEPDPEKPNKKNPLKVADDLDDAIRYLVEGVDRGIIGDPNVLFKNTLAGMKTVSGPETFRERMRKIRMRNTNG